ncbi:VOC family protein [Leptospira ognonensis]|uniref:VOC family protein n=1 Tax=Leptospira ognonensis TaxID=2484945 RepID=A0A4R9K8S9_9LEPT|nr:VOC family protein [Leptospira ognonensis]TGL61896.1 VOC family protein [Leptospira ognonensis]
MIHHIAIGTPNVRKLADFYLKLPHAEKLKEWLEADGTLRSIWIQFSETILMIEIGEKMAPRALVFGFEVDDEKKWNILLETIPLSHKTEFTKYFLDPDGNQLGLSSYPETLPE